MAGEGENNKIDARVVIACTVDLGWERSEKKRPRQIVWEWFEGEKT